MLRLVFAALLAADPEAALRYDVTVETAAPAPHPLDRTAPSTTVITADQIRNSGAVGVADLLRRVAGVDVTRSGSPGKVTLARVGGASAAQTLVLVDGVEINSPTLGVADLADISVDNVERIEVVRGPLSALHGSAAMGGVIQIFTRRGGDGNGASGEIEGGSWSSWRGAGNVAGGSPERVAWTLAGSRSESDGRSFESSGGPAAHDAYANTTASASLDARPGKGYEVALSGRYTDARRDLPIEVFGARAFDLNATQADEGAVLSARIATEAGRWSPRLRVGYAVAQQDFDDPIDPGESGPFAGDFSAAVETRRLEAALESGIRLAKTDSLLLGASFERREGQNEDSFSGLNFDRSFDTTSVYAHNRFEASGWIVELGARLDDIESYGSTVSPKASLLWQPAGTGTRVRLGAGRGFRAPSLNELAFPFYGNPDLEPESSWTYEAAFGGRWAEERIDAEVRVFRSDFDHLIVTDPESFTAMNLDSARVEGGEIELRVWPARGWWARASATIQQARDRNSGERLLRHPERKAAIGAGFERSHRYRIAVDLLAVGGQRDLKVAGFSEDLPGWSRVDVAGALTLPLAGQRLELFGRVENLLDSDYQESTGFPAPGINGRGGLRLRL